MLAGLQQLPATLLGAAAHARAHARCREMSLAESLDAVSSWLEAVAASESALAPS